MSVRDRVRLFDPRPQDHSVPPRPSRSQSESATQNPQHHHDLPLVILDPSPLDDALPKKSAPPAVKPKPIQLSARKPPLPQRLKSSDGVIRSSVISREPYRITLTDLDESDCEETTPSTSDQDDTHSAPEASLKSLTPANTPQSILEDAKKRTALISTSVLKDARNLADIGRRKSNDAANAMKRSTGPLAGKIGEHFNQLKTNTVQTLDKSGIPKAMDNAVTEAKRTAGTAGTGAQKVLDKTGIPEAFVRTKEDIMDIQAQYKGVAGLCSKCSTLPLHLCVPSAGDCPSPEVFWASPLSRVIYHSRWCRICGLILQMLCRPEFDPMLKHPDVSKHLPEELKGMSMAEWVSKGWSYTNQNWPFGHGDQRHEGATYVLGQMGNIVTESSKDMLSYGVAVASYIAIGSSLASTRGRTFRYRRPSGWKTFSEGMKRARENKTTYPLSCVVQISMRTSVDLESPGLLFVDLIGCGRALNADAKPLSQFRLRAVERGVMQRSLSTGPLSYGRVLNREWIDLAAFKVCLEACEKHHGAGCGEHGFAEAMPKPGFLRVIDCEDMCITQVSNPEICRFVALSYVWGRSATLKLQFSNIAQLSRPRGLRAHIKEVPSTIVNAIDVVKDMGERYLWVDALCILQEKTREALEQIATMDRIYGSAILTIVASDGSDADTGLRGVSGEGPANKPRQLDQPLSEFRDNIAVIAPFDNPQKLDESVWNLRAWTFQERLLSRRILVFGKNEAVWHCRAMTAREDMLVHDSGYGDPLKDWLSLQRQYLIPGEHWKDGSLEVDRHGHTRIVRSGTFHEYTKMVQQYSYRQMTYDHDVINALTGLLNIFDLCFKSTMIFGMPEVLFDIALLWTPTEQLTRRPTSGGKTFPSWSWAGWKGRVTYDKPYAFRRDNSRSPTRVIQADDGEEGVRPMIRWHLWSKSISSLRRINGSGVGLPLSQHELPEEWEKKPYQSHFDRSVISNFEIDANQIEASRRIHLQEQHLVFWTSCSTAFSFGDAATQPSDRQWTTTKAPLRYSLADRDFQWSGTVLLDSNSPEHFDSDRHEWIMLGEAQFYRLDDEPRDVEGYNLYIAMLVVWNHRTKVASRLGLGRIMKTAWHAGAPRMKMVVLG